VDNASELISQIQPQITPIAPLTYTPTGPITTNIGSSDADVSSIVDNASELISQIQPQITPIAPLTYTPTDPITATIGSSDTDVISIVDSATELISHIQSPIIPLTYTPSGPIDTNIGSSEITPEPKWYEPSDKYKQKDTLNINIPSLSLNKNLAFQKENGNTIIKETKIMK
jgi:hypothetical protein